MTEEALEEAVAPAGRCRRPRDLEPARDRIGTAAASEAALPAEALLLERRALRLRPDVGDRVGRAVGLAEAVAADDQRDRLFVVHRHAAERLADVARRGERIRVAVRAFRVDVDEPHLHGGERILELAIAGVALVAEPRRLRAPVDVLVGLPHVFAAARVAEGLEAHRLERDVAGEHEQVSPRELLAVALLDRPQEAARLVEVCVVGPAVERCEALLAGSRAAAPVADPVGAGAVPRHPDDERPVVAPVRRPPVLRGRQHLLDVRLDGGEVEAPKRRCVVELRAERVCDVGILGEDLQVQPVGPPAAVRIALGRMGGASVLDGAAVSVLLVHLADDGVRLLGHANPFSGSGSSRRRSSW